ncbi:MAG: HesA/MoeB/ThiF family protein [Desulfobacteraceae bacterium]|nr:MAG: HesA/MoeB/ThiF family protein [Desulfobacteraceae bacterium]
MNSQEVLEQITLLALETTAPGGTPLKTLRADQIRGLASRYNLPERDIELAALSTGVFPLRYVRNQRTYTSDDQIRLLNASAAIVGLGGLGGSVLDILARAGVGRLTLIDGDRFEEHNLNRQLLCVQPCLGVLKAEAAGRRALEINCAIQTDVHPVFLTAENAASLIGGCDVVLDCLDNIASRFVLEEAAQKNAIPMVSAAVAGVMGQVTTIYPQDDGLQLIHGQRTSIKPHGAEKALGCLPQAVMLVAAVESGEALKILTGRTGELLRNRLWVADLATNMFEVLSLG